MAVATKCLRQGIRIVKLSSSQDFPLSVREALRGVEISAIIINDDMRWKFPNVPKGSCFTYVGELLKLLRDSGFKQAVKELRILCKNDDDICVFEPSIFELV